MPDGISGMITGSSISLYVYLLLPFLNAENADVALRYIDDDPDSYPGIFENAKFKVSQADQKRVIEALKTLSTGENWKPPSTWTRCSGISPCRFCDELGQLSGPYRAQLLFV